MSWTVYRHITPSGKSYIGITSKKPEERWQNGRGYKEGSAFRSAIDKYGWNDIQHNIVSSDLTEKEAKWLENYLICYYRTFVCFKDCKGYNMTLGGDGSTGYKHSEETKLKQSESNKGEKNHNYGKHLTDETKLKISEANKGKTSYFKGKHHTEESRRKLSEARKGIKFSDEHRRRISEAQTGDKNYWYGKHRPKETCIKNSESHIGQPCPTKGMHRVYHEDGTFHMER